MSLAPSHISKSQKKALVYEERLKKILTERKGLCNDYYDSKRKEYRSSINENTAMKKIWENSYNCQYRINQ